MKRRAVVVGLTALLAGCTDATGNPIDPSPSTPTPTDTATDVPPTPADCYTRATLERHDVSAEREQHIEPIVYESTETDVQGAIDEMIGSDEEACFQSGSETAEDLRERGRTNRNAQIEAYRNDTGEDLPAYLEHAFVRKDENYYTMSLTQGDQVILH